MQQKEATILTILALVGTLTAAPLPLGGGLYIPFFVLFVITAYLLAARWRLLSNRDMIFLIGCFGLLTANLLFSGVEGFTHQLKALLQLMAAFCLAVFVPKIFQALGKERLRSILKWTIATLVVLTALERAGITRELSDGWRHMVLQGSAFTDPYASDARDLDMVGFVRPKVFAPEPAYLAGFLFVCFTCLSLIAREKLTAVGLVAANLICWFLIGSPVLLLSLVAVVVTLLYRLRGDAVYVLPLVLAAGLVLVLHPPDSLSSEIDSLQSRFSGLMKADSRFLQDDSVRSRVYVPFAIGVPTALDHNAFWGVGIGGKERLSEMVDPNYSRYSQDIGSTENTIGTNSLGSMIATLGIFGTLALFGLVVWYWSPIGVGPLALSLISVFLFLFTRGAYETQGFWFAVFLIVGAAGIVRIETSSMTLSPSSEPSNS